VLAFTAGLQAQKQEKPPEAEVLELSVKREETNVVIDGKIKNVSAKPIRGVVLLFDFLASDGKQVLTRKRGGIEEDPLGPGDEAEFHVQVPNPSRSVFLRLEVEDSNGKYYRTANAGPYTIE
jgi:hypothetical protein